MLQYESELEISRILVEWYETYKRELPWRETRDPYIIWISEIILQQTRVVQGLEYFLRFTERFPDVASLAVAEEDEVLKYWQGLGYYSRARNLHAAAKSIMERFNGVFPENYKEVLSLKGIGEYTAAAIVSFAWNQPCPVVDGNVYRVLSRLFAVDTPIDTTKGKKQFAEQSLEEKMALMEKSYELAARYNGKQTPSVIPTDDRKDRTSVKPVKRIRQEVVSSLAQPVNDGDFIAGVSEERNTGFHTPVGRTPVSDRNTIAACVHGTQTVSDGQALRVRLLEAMAVDDRLIPKGTVLTGETRIQGERMDIVITNVEYQGTVIPVELEVYDADGQQGILIPNSLEYDAVREIAAGMGGSMGSSISISTDAGAQIASDLGKGVIQGVSQYITKKMRTVKVTLKAGHRLLLHSPKQ